MALIQAVDKYKPSRGRLATYARRRIRGKIMDYIDKYRTLVHVPKPLRKQVNRFRSALETLGGSAADEEIAAVMDCSLEELQEIRCCSEQYTESLEAPVVTDTDEEVLLAEAIGTDDADIAAVDYRQLLEFALSFVKPEEAEVLRLRLGIGGGKEMSVREVAEVVGLSKSWVSNTEHAALEKIRQHEAEILGQRDSPGEGGQRPCSLLCGSKESHLLPY